MAESNARWFVIHTYSGYENKVASNILTAAANKKMDDQILDVKIPFELVKTVKSETKSAQDFIDDYEDDFIEDEDDEDLTEAERAAIRKKKARKEAAKEKAKKEPKEVERKLFPGYVFVRINCVYKKQSDFDEEELSMSDEAWYIIRNTRGVTSFVGPGSKPVPLSDEEVKKLDIEKTSVEVDYKVGDLVSVLSGPFDGFSGRVQSIDLEKGIVVISISMLGRDTPVDLPLNQVKSIID